MPNLLPAALIFCFDASSAFAKTIRFNASEGKVAAACGSKCNGGGSTYGCVNQNCDHNGGDCMVICQKKDHTCYGMTPDRVVGAVTLADILGDRAALAPVAPFPDSPFGGGSHNGGGEGTPKNDALSHITDHVTAGSKLGPSIQ